MRTILKKTLINTNSVQCLHTLLNFGLFSEGLLETLEYLLQLIKLIKVVRSLKKKKDKESEKQIGNINFRGRLLPTADLIYLTFLFKSGPYLF